MSFVLDGSAVFLDNCLKNKCEDGDVFRQSAYRKSVRG